MPNSNPSGKKPTVFVWSTVRKSGGHSPDRDAIGLTRAAEVDYSSEPTQIRSAPSALHTAWPPQYDVAGACHRSYYLRPMTSAYEMSRCAVCSRRNSTYMILQSDWARAADYWRRSTSVIRRRAERGTAVASNLAGLGKSEAQQNDWYFWGLVKVAHRLAAESDTERALQREMCTPRCGRRSDGPWPPRANL